MARPKKDGKTLTMKLSGAVYDQLEKFCEETGVPKTTAVEKVLGAFLKNYFSKPEEDRALFK